MKKTRKAKAKTARAKKAEPSIMVDGISYKIPKHLRDATDEEITRVIRGWRTPIPRTEIP